MQKIFRKRKNPPERAEFQMVEATGFEPVTSWSRTKRATKLHHASMTMKFYSNLNEMTINKLSKKAPEGASFALSLSNYSVSSSEFSVCFCFLRSLMEVIF